MKNNQSLKKIIKGAIRGDHQSKEMLIERKFQDVLYFAARQTNLQEAEEIAQNVMIHLYNQIHMLRDPDKFQYWLMSMVYHECSNYMKKLRKNPLYTSDTSDDYEEPLHDHVEFLPEEYVLNEEKRRVLLDTINEMPRHYAECLTLYYLEGLSREEVAQVLEVNKKKVYNDLGRGRVLLKKMIEDKSNTVLAYSVVPGGAIPMLTKALCTDREIFSASEQALTALQDMKNTLGSLSGQTVPVKRAGLSTSGRFAAGIVVAGLAIGGVAIGLRHQQTEPEPVKSMPVEETVEIEAEPVAELSEEVPEREIRTVADMIGEEPAGRLERYTTGEVTEAEWETFITECGAEQEEVSTEPYNTYTRYTLYKQDKRLMLAMRKHIDGQLTVLYTFENREAELPEMFDVILMFEEP